MPGINDCICLAWQRGIAIMGMLGTIDVNTELKIQLFRIKFFKYCQGIRRLFPVNSLFKILAKGGIISSIMSEGILLH